MKPIPETPAKPPVIIPAELVETPWAQSVQKQARNDWMWIGAGLVVLGCLAAIGMVLSLFFFPEVVFRSEDTFWGWVTISGSGLLLVSTGLMLAIIRPGRPTEIALSSALAVAVSTLMGILMAGLFAVAFVIFLFVQCFRALSGGG